MLDQPERELDTTQPQPAPRLYATTTDDPLLETRLDPLTDSLEGAADLTIAPIIEDPGSHQSNHGNTGYGEDDDHHDRADLKTRGRGRGRG